MPRRLKRHPLLIRLIVVAFFIGFNVVLAAIFFAQTQYVPPPALQSLFVRLGLPVATESLPAKFSRSEDDFTQQQLLVAINTTRIENDLAPVDDDPQLTAVAQELLTISAQYDYDFDQFDAEKALEELLIESGYAYAWVSQTTLLGPTTADAAIHAWEAEEYANEALRSNEAIDIGLAAKIIDSAKMGRIGVILQVLAKPRENRQLNPAVTPPPAQQPLVFPKISDQEVLEALNLYRAAHGVYALTENNELCQYAQKRVQDLIAYGGLDNHEGFRRDFDDPENRPVGLKNYRPGLIGENLAYQYCRNMTTGASFIAETGTSLIEWCFDSSTLGHREAQLSTTFENVCSRHQDGYYVIIFGE